MYQLERTVSDIQLTEFLNNPCTSQILEMVSGRFKDAIMDCTPAEIDKREHAYFMYHAVKSFETELRVIQMELQANKIK